MLKQLKKLCMYIVLICMIATCLPGLNLFANSTELFRVALFVDNGQGYRNTIPQVTLEADAALSITGTRGQYINVNNSRSLGFTVDQYHLVALNTTSGGDARQLALRLSEQNIHHKIIQHGSQSPLYQVVVYSEPTLQAIQARQQELLAAMGIQAEVAGPLRVEAGQYHSYAEANQAVDQLTAHGYAAAIAEVVNGSNLYKVVAGHAATVEQQQQLIQALQQSLPGQSFVAHTDQQYVIWFNQAFFATSSVVQTQPLIAFSAQEKLRIQSTASSGVPVTRVVERNNRLYRGVIELSQFHGKLTVVNELPFEEYIYGVTGTEMGGSWPVEALKAQAIIARNFANGYKNAPRYGVAHVSDTTLEQAYYGFLQETANVRAAVDETRGQYMAYNGEIFRAFYYSNAGGHTAIGTEVWLSNLEHHSSVASFDQYPETIQTMWYRIQDNQGRIGYVASRDSSSVYVEKLPQKNEIGLHFGEVKVSSLNFRSGPATTHDRVGSLAIGERVVILEEIRQDNAYSWISSIYTGNELMEIINRNQNQRQLLTQPVTRLQVTRYGQSGRAQQIQANGVTIDVNSPDAYRTVLARNGSSLRSTKFEIEEMGNYTVLGAGGRTVQGSQQPNATLYAISGASKGSAVSQVNQGQEMFVALGKGNKLQVMSRDNLFRFRGNGFGHGLGLSQWGAYSMAQQGYDYVQILKHYYHPNISIVQH